MRLAAISLFGAIALAGCNAQPAAEPVAKKAEEAPKPEIAADGWDRLLGAPQTTIPAVNQFGFRAGEFGGSGTARAEGSPIMVAGTIAEKPNTANFAAQGKTAERIDELRFTLSITDPINAAVAKQRFGEIIGNVLATTKADGTAPVRTAINAEQSAGGALQGADYAVLVEPIAGAERNRTITVTFTPSVSNPSKS